MTSFGHRVYNDYDLHAKVIPNSTEIFFSIVGLGCNPFIEMVVVLYRGSFLDE